MVSGLAASLGAEVPVQHVVLRGKVVTLAAALDAKKLGIRADAEPTASTIVLLSEDGTITPLLSDEASRVAGQAVWRPAVFSGRHVQDRARRQAADARVLLQYLRDQRPVPAGLPVLPGADGVADEAGEKWPVTSGP